MSEVLGIPVDDDLLHRWRGWFCPAEQPFDVSALPADLRRLVPDGPEAEPTAEVRDTFLVYSRGWRMFSRQSFDELPPAVRRALVRGRDETLRPLRWPDDLAAAGDGPLVAYVEVGVLPSREARSTRTRGSARAPCCRGPARSLAPSPSTPGPTVSAP